MMSSAVSINSSPHSMKLGQSLLTVVAPSCSSASPSPNSSISSNCSSVSSPSPTHSHHNKLNLQQQQQQHQAQSHFQLPQFHLIHPQFSHTIKKEPGLISPPELISIQNENNYINNNNNNNNNNVAIKNGLITCSPAPTGTTAPTNNINNNSGNNNNNNATTIVGSNSNNANENLNSKCKRKINFSSLGIPRSQQPATVARRNARERNRVKQVNNGFAALKQHIPLTHRSKKMSKVETLRCAVEYIKNLKTLLDPGIMFSDDDGASGFGNGLQFDFTQQLSPSSSEDPSSPSYASENSYVVSTSSSSGHNNGNGNSSSNSNNQHHHNHSHNNNVDNSGMYDYENYEPVSPEDEELLDAISWWQQS